ncbi:hypothetical protein XENTR_v10014470 [Xenopus tropicalis]|nr:hypothetical protein XENTR_v10014470 [Xenopus tropicalis]
MPFIIKDILLTGAAHSGSCNFIVTTFTITGNIKMQEDEALWYIRCMFRQEGHRHQHLFKCFYRQYILPWNLITPSLGKWIFFIATPPPKKIKHKQTAGGNVRHPQ